MWIVFHSRVEGLVCISTGMWGVCSTVEWRVCVYFHRHVAVCSTVVWRFCVYFYRLCVFHSHVEGLMCISTGMWGVCVPQLCGGFV